MPDAEIAAGVERAGRRLREIGVDRRRRVGRGGGPGRQGVEIGEDRVRGRQRRAVGRGPGEERLAGDLGIEDAHGIRKRPARGGGVQHRAGIVALAHRLDQVDRQILRRGQDPPEALLHHVEPKLGQRDRLGEDLVALERALEREEPRQIAPGRVDSGWP